MSFKVNDKVTVVDSGQTYSTYRDWMEEHGKQWKSQWKSQWAYNVDPKNGIVATIVAKGKYGGFYSDMLYLIQCDDKVYIIGEQGIKAVETVGFKLGDEVKVTSINNHGNPASKETIGHQGIIVGTGVSKQFKVKFDELVDECYYWFFNTDELQLVTEPMTYKEALLHTLNKTKLVRHTSMAAGEYLVFDGKWTDNDGIRRGINSIDDNDGHWEEFTEPPKPPKFTTGTLVYKTDGTIGKIMEDKGVYKGIRKYSVSFNAIRDTVKTVDESELTSYESR